MDGRWTRQLNGDLIGVKPRSLDRTGKSVVCYVRRQHFLFHSVGTDAVHRLPLVSGLFLAKSYLPTNPLLTVVTVEVRMVQEIEPAFSSRFQIVEIEHASEAFATMNSIID